MPAVQNKAAEAAGESRFVLQRSMLSVVTIAFAGFAAMLPISAASMETFDRLMIFKSWI